jgi:hypothetical protein
LNASFPHTTEAGWSRFGRGYMDAGKRRRPGANADTSAVLALRALSFLAEEPERLGRFLALSGLGPDELRIRASDPVLLGGVLDHLLADEPLLLAFAATQGVEPEEIASARRHLPGATPWE